MTMLTIGRINELVDQVNAALLDSDWATLEQLVAPGARVVGPRGFMITRDRWIGAHQEAAYEQEALEVVESDINSYGSAGVRVDVVESRCGYQGEAIAGRFRVTQTWVTSRRQTTAGGRPVHQRARGVTPLRSRRRLMQVRPAPRRSRVDGKYVRTLAELLSDHGVLAKRISDVTPHRGRRY